MRPLIIVFPPAMATRFSMAKTIIELEKIGKVKLIESGYYGISTIANNFDQEFEIQMTKIGSRKIILVAGSVGAIHALTYYQNHPEKVQAMVLAAPAIYKHYFWRTPFFLALIKIVLFLDPERIWHWSSFWTKNWIFGNKIRNSVGLKSYILCLEEIVNFGVKQQKNLSKLLANCAVILGKEDKFIQKLCDYQACHQSKICVHFDGNHDVLQNSYPIIASVVKDASIVPPKSGWSE